MVNVCPQRVERDHPPDPNEQVRRVLDTLYSSTFHTEHLLYCDAKLTMVGHKAVLLHHLGDVLAILSAKYLQRANSWALLHPYVNTVRREKFSSPYFGRLQIYPRPRHTYGWRLKDSWQPNTGTAGKPNLPVA